MENTPTPKEEQKTEAKEAEQIQQAQQALAALATHPPAQSPSSEETSISNQKTVTPKATKTQAAVQQPKKQKKHYASINNPTIEAITAGHFRFANEAQALARLEAVRDTFIVSRLPDGEEAPPPDALRLWIRGFDVTPEEKEDGCVGNYALIRVRNTNEGKYTLLANKLPTEKKYHPQRKRNKSRHPNWGHPILRSIKKKKIYSSLEETQAEILALHEEYPEISIPCTGKMYVMIYQKTEDGTSPVKKWVLEVKVADEGGFYFEYTVNTYSAPKGKKSTGQATTKSNATDEKSQPDGYFSSMVQLKRARKKKPAPTASATAAAGAKKPADTESSSEDTQT